MNQLQKNLRRWAKSLPYIRRLAQERDELRAEVGNLGLEVMQLRAAIEDVCSKRDSAKAEVDRLIERFAAERDAAKAEAARYKTWVPPGHFYSPIVSLEEVRLRERQIFNADFKTIAGIDLREQDQVQLVKELARYYHEMDFPTTRQPTHRYYCENTNYSHFDALILYSMIRHLKPRRIVEVGSGFSSCITLDTNERYFGGSICCTFVDPYPDLLKSLLKPGDTDRIVIVPKTVQDVGDECFLALEENDIVFIDSTHVSKTNSDVNYLLFKVLPILQRGVYIHVHDIFFPFEYPSDWIYEGRSWNENYILRAFLYANAQFRIELFASFLNRFHEDILREYLPLCSKNGGNMWLKKIGERHSCAPSHVGVVA